MDLVNKLVVFYSSDILRLSFSVFVKKSPSFQKVDIFSELYRCTPCVFIGTVARFSRNKSLLVSFVGRTFFSLKFGKAFAYFVVSCLLANVNIKTELKDQTVPYSSWHARKIYFY